VRFDPREIPKPITEADYAARFRANTEESRDKLELARALFSHLRHSGQITENADTTRLSKWIFADANAARAYGNVVRHQSDLEHWHRMMVQAERGMRADAVTEREPGEDG
jgi:hypothetical protein